jgi:hypothetical protein
MLDVEALLPLVHCVRKGDDCERRRVQDSSAKGVGIGTEDSLKNKGGYMASYYTENGSGVGAGTKAIKKKVLPKKKSGKK